MRTPTLCALLLLPAAVFADRPLTLTIVHTNDLHAHVEPTNIRRKPYGGYARQATIIRQIRAKEKNVLLLSAGDTFQGTLYFNVYEGLADLTVLNALRYDAMAVGNHEFDRGPAALGTFASLTQFPILSANLDVSAEPTLNGRIRKSTVLTVDKQKIGVVGCTTSDLPNISSPGPSVKMTDLVTSVQSEVDALTKQGINKIIVLSHIGYEEDQELVGKLHDVDLVVGGHSHTPLGTPTLDGWPKPGGAYPTYVKDATGASVPIVQAWEWGKVVGHLRVKFDGKGHVTKVEDAQPVVVDESVPEDPEVKALVTALQRPIAQLQSQRVGEASIPITRDVKSGESLMANVIADGMQETLKAQGAVVSFINAGGVRGNLEAGPVTYGQAISIQPFGNSLVVLDVTGAELKQALEQGTGAGGQLTPSAGSRYRIDKSQPKGSQVQDVVISGSPLDLGRIYRVGLLSFSAGGGDSLFAFRDAKGARRDTGLIDLDAFLAYIKAHSPLNPTYEQRIREN